METAKPVLSIIQKAVPEQAAEKTGSLRKASRIIFYILS